jgi:hypothetical protein
MTNRLERTPRAPKPWVTGLDVFLGLVAFPDVLFGIAVLVGLSLTGGIFFAFTSGWWPIIGTTLVGAIFIGAVILLLLRQGRKRPQRRHSSR